MAAVKINIFLFTVFLKGFLQTKCLFVGFGGQEIQILICLISMMTFRPKNLVLVKFKMAAAAILDF